jgi:hypothetical protein
MAPKFQESSRIKKYDGSSKPAEWLKVYQLAIKAAGWDSFIMVNYLSICLSSLVRTWLQGLPSGSVRSCSHQCLLFTTNFHATCVHPGVDWDLASIVQKKGESLRVFIQRFCKKRNIIPDMDDKSNIMFFKKRLTDSSLICKLTMKNPWTS